MTVDHHPFEATLLAYASGHLPEGLSLAVATHLAWCAECRDAVAAAETAAGLLLAQGPQAECSDALLARTLSALDHRPQPAHQPPPAPRQALLQELKLPQPLQGYVQRLGPARWRWLAPGVAQIPLIGRTGGGGSARLLRVRPGMRMPRHGHCGSELAVVLSGAYDDELGRFARGDLADHGEEVTHQPRSDLREGCVCLIATDRPLRFSTPLLRLVQPMLGI